MNIEALNKLVSKDGFHEIDIQFAEYIMKTARKKDSILYLTAALASHSVRNANICCNLKDIAETEFPLYKSGIELLKNSEILPTITLPNLNLWQETLSKYPEIVSKNGYTPLILDDSYRLYLHRYWNYENSFANEILKKCSADTSYIKKLKPKQITNISNYFSDISNNEIDWQQIAVYTALANNFSIITGGPGTGKTTTVSAILSIMLDINPKLKIKLCAPTGKAAGRLIDAINNELQNLNPENNYILEELKKLEAFTVHRLLGYIPMSPHFKHNSKKTINADVIVIDEASMLPQTLFSKLFDAISENTKIILLGDKDQLSSVEAGAVMANLCEAAKTNNFTEKFLSSMNKYFECKLPNIPIVKDSNSKLNNIAVELKKSYRFSDTKGIGLLKNAANNNVSNILEIAKSIDDELKLIPLPKQSQLKHTVIKYIQNTKITVEETIFNFKDYLASNSPEQAYNILNEFKILCSHNTGPTGVEIINKIVHNFFFKEPFHKLPVGTPIIIQENSNQLKLFNGDTGIIWYDSKKNKKAFFSDTITGKMKPYSIALLPPYKEVFAMTIHKSQGSGFQNVLIILPKLFSPVLTKELIYTAITRAKKYCEIWANNDIFKKAAGNITKRNSGLTEKLR